MASSDSESPRPIFWERLQGLFTRSERPGRPDEKPRRGRAIALCIFASCFLWFVFTLQDDYTAVLDFPTRVYNLPSGEALTARPPRSARVQVRGEGIQLLRLSYNPPVLPIDAMAGEINLEEGVMPELPRGVRLENVSPRFVELQKEERVTRTLPIRLRGRIEASASHDLREAPQLTPDSVTVSGARSLVSSLQAWPTEPVEVADVTDSLLLRVPLADTLEGLVRRSADIVTVRALAQSITEGVREIEVRVPGAPQRAVTLEPRTVEVRYRTFVADWERAQQTPDFYATVPYEEILADTTGRVTPQVHLPAGLSISDVQISPPTLRYYTFQSEE